jgi:hypothetical protein
MKFFFEPYFSLFFVICISVLLGVVIINHYSIFWVLLIVPIWFIDIIGKVLVSIMPQVQRHQA